VHTFDCGVVIRYERALDELNGHGGLADTTTSDNDELVFTQEIGLRKEIVCVRRRSMPGRSLFNSERKEMVLLTLW
jgi:hypothetical protein